MSGRYGSRLVPSSSPSLLTWQQQPLGALTVFAIDLIDNFIQLGTLQHPVQTQTLLLTRSILFPGTIRRTTLARSTRKTVPCEGSRGRSRTRKVLVSTTLLIDRAGIDIATPTNVYELEGSLPSRTLAPLARVSSVQRPLGYFVHKSRPLSTPSIVCEAGDSLKSSSAICTSTQTSTHGLAITRFERPEFPATPRRATLPSPEVLHVDTLLRRQASPSELLEKPATAEFEQPELARSFPAQTTPPTTPIEMLVPMTPESLPYSFNNRPSPAFACSTVSSALKVRPKTRARTLSVQAARGGGVETSSRLSSASSGRLGGSPGSVREAVKVSEESL